MCLGRGYGQIVRYFLQDNNISYEDIRFKHEDWPAKREEMIAANKTPAATAPYVETADGACYGRTLPILRRLTKTIPGMRVWMLNNGLLYLLRGALQH